MASTVLVSGTYQHYKGQHYQVLGISRCSETLEEFVVYRALYGDFGLWIRPAGMFVESVTINNQQIPRFKLIKEERKI